MLHEAQFVIRFQLHCYYDTVYTYMYLDNHSYLHCILLIFVRFSCLLTWIVTQPHIATQRHIPLPRYSLGPLISLLLAISKAVLQIFQSMN